MTYPNDHPHRSSAILRLAVIAVVLAAALATAAVFVFRGGDQKASSGSSSNGAGTSDRSDSAADCTQTRPAILSGGTFRTMSAVGYAGGSDVHLEAPYSTNYQPCAPGITYAALKVTDTREATVAFAVFVDGKLGSYPVYVISGAEIESADPAKIVAKLAYRPMNLALAEPPVTATVTITQHDGNIVTTPDLADLFGNIQRLKLDDQPVDPTPEIPGPHDGSTMYRLAPQEVYGPTGEYSFQMPSGNIACSTERPDPRDPGPGASLACYTKYSFRSDGQHCPDRSYVDGTAQIVRWDAGADRIEAPCTDFWGGIYNEDDTFKGETLPYGFALKMPVGSRVITCYSREENLACADPRGWSFTLARDGFRRYKGE